MKHVTAAFLLDFLGGLLLYPVLLGFFGRRGIGQRIQQYTLRSHQVKSGTPTMGGILFVGLLIATWLLLDRTRGGFVIVFAVSAGAAVGFLDDMANTRGEGALGLRSLQKLMLQVVVGLLVGFGVHYLGESDQFIPFLGLHDMGWWIVPVCAIAVVAATNAVNITDGVDGLAASCTAVCLLGLLIVAYQIEDNRAAIIAAALLGGILAFLFYNWHPARVFMGDTGALAIGCALTALCVELRLIWLLPLLGLVFVVETASVIINVTAIRKFHRRVFRASPIHHHFELMGLREDRLVLAFAEVGVVAMALTVLSARALAVLHG